MSTKSKKAKFSVRLRIKQNGKCTICGEDLGDPKDLNVDHIYPKNPPKGYPKLCRSWYSYEQRKNLQLVHRRCNTLKDNKITPEGLRLGKEILVGRLVRYLSHQVDTMRSSC